MLPEPGDRARPGMSPEARETFLEALAAAYSVTRAASLAGVHRSSFYRLREADEEFAEAWADAFEAGTDVLRDELRRRALEGNEEPVVSAGKILGYVTRFDHRDLALELRRRDASYRDRPDVAISLGVGIDNGHKQVQRGPEGFTLASLLDQAFALTVGNMFEASIGSFARSGNLGLVLEWAATKPAAVQERVQDILVASGRLELEAGDTEAAEIVGFEDVPMEGGQ